MGVLPGGAGDVNTGQPFMNSAAGNGTQSLSQLDTLNQGKVNGVYQAQLGGGASVFSNPAGPLGLLFGPGIAGFPDAFAQLLGKLLGFNGPVTNINQVIQAAERVPVLGELVEVLTGVEDGDLN